MRGLPPVILVVVASVLVVIVVAVVVTMPASVSSKDVRADAPPALPTKLAPTGGDDTARIQAALGDSRVVQLDAGVFRVTSTITIDGDRALLGSGEGITTISSTAPAQTIQVNSGTGVTTHTARFEDLTLDGNTSGQVGIRWGQTAVTPKTGTGSMRNVTVRRFTEAGVQLVVTVALRLDGITLMRNKYGLHFAAQHDNGNTTVHVQGCWCKQNTIGLFMENGLSVTVRDSIFEENAQEGVLVLRPDSPTMTTRNITFADNHFEKNNVGRSGTNHQFRAQTAGAGIIQALGLERNTFVDSGGSNRHVLFGKGRFRDLDNEYVSPTAGAVTCENSTACFVFSRNDRAPSEFWTLPSGTPPVTWQQGVNMWTNVGGTPTKR